MGCSTYDDFEDSVKKNTDSLIDVFAPGYRQQYDVVQKNPELDPLHIITEDPLLAQAEEEAQRVRTEDEAREAQISEDKARINALFGVTDYDYGDYRSDKTVPLGELNPDLVGLGEYEGSSFGGPWEKLFNFTKEAVAKEMPIGMSLAQEAEQNLATREGTLSGIHGDIMAKSTEELDRQFGRKEADVIAMLMDRGISRSTVGQTTMDRLGEIYDEQEIGFNTAADTAVERIKDKDISSRANLISLIEAGGDYANAASLASAGMESDAAQAKNEALAADLTNLFAGMDELYGQKQYVDAYNTGQTYGGTNIATPGSFSAGDSGSVIRY